MLARMISNYSYPIAIVTILFAGSIGLASAWTGPSYAPPNNNVSAPVNVGTTAQVKNGGLSVNSLAVFGNSILSGSSLYLNFGVTAGTSGYGIRDNGGTMEFKNSTGAWAAMSTSSTAVSGTTSYVPKFTSPTALGNSLIYDNGTGVGIGATTLSAKLHVTGGTGTGVYGDSTSATGVYGNSGTGYGVYGVSSGSYGVTGIGGTAGVLGYSVGALTGSGWYAYGMLGHDNGSNAFGVYGSAANYAGGYGGFFTGGTAGTGVRGTTGGDYGVYGTYNGSSSGFIPAGVFGNTATAGAAGVRGASSAGSGYGVYCTGPTCGGNKVWTNTSDVRLKTEIKTLSAENGLDAILKLRPVTYKWKDASDYKNLGDQYGFIAQEVEKVLPSAVITNDADADIRHEDGTIEKIKNPKAMSYATVVVPLVKAVQQLKAENDSLNLKNEKLEKRIELLEERLTK